MRYVDIDELEALLPAGWAERAATALNALRNAVVAAEAQAMADAENPIEARKAAIRTQLKTPANMKIWQDLNVVASSLTGGKCWYSESRNPTADKNVDHFRPKNRVAEEPDHEGYWWLAFDWRNYRFVSQWCNQKRIDKINATKGGKADHFPLVTGSFRARAEPDDWKTEQPLLLDPTAPDDWRLITFRADGKPTPSAQSGTVDFDRAQESIDVYHLHCFELTNERRLIAGQVRRIVESLEELRPQIADPVFRSQYQARQKELLRAIRETAGYSSAALAFVRQQIYSTVSGQQVKRQWLADMLD